MRSGRRASSTAALLAFELVGRRAAIALLALVACKRAPEPAPLDVASDAGPAISSAASPVVDGGFAPARCAFEEGGNTRVTLHDVGTRGALLVGDAVLAPGGLAVGIAHAPATGPEALVARVTGDKVAEWVVAKSGEIVPDAPPPKPLVAAGALYAAYIARGLPGDNTALRRLVLKKEGVDASIAAYAERTSESLTFDAALSNDGTRAALVWDEDGVGGNGGITIGVVPLGGGGSLPPRVVSGDAADPDAARIAPRVSGGWWVAWTAHRPEVGGDAGGRIGSAVEAPAEDRVYSWIELAIVGDDGTVTAPPRRITPLQGHVASFDLAPRTGGSARALDVVARDETQLREGDGGRIVHVVVAPDGSAEETQTLVQSGVGRGSVDLIGTVGGEAWLAFAGTQDRTMIVPFGSARAGAGVPSVEELLEGGRLLSLEASPEPGRPDESRFLGAFPGVEGSSLFRRVVCAH